MTHPQEHPMTWDMLSETNAKLIGELEAFNTCKDLVLARYTMQASDSIKKSWEERIGNFCVNCDREQEMIRSQITQIGSQHFGKIGLAADSDEHMECVTLGMMYTDLIDTISQTLTPIYLVAQELERQLTVDISAEQTQSVTPISGNT